ncbi:hypothetical protein [Caudoviricetes sp.]|nr:hypothetical protein [Caudoviricetes sp.]
MNLRTLHVKGKILSVPPGWVIHHTTLIEPKEKNSKPYFCVLLTKEEEKKEHGVGFRI